MERENWKMGIVQAVVLVFAVIILIYAWIGHSSEESAYCDGKVMQLSSGWMLENQEITVPIQLSDYPLNSITVTRQLEDVEDSDTLVVRSLHTQLKVYLDDELLYEFGDKETTFFEVPISNWNVIPMKKEYSGRELKIVNMTTVSKYKGDIGTVYLGDKTAILLELIGRNSTILICAVIIFSISMLMVVLWFVIGKENRSGQILYLAAFGFLVAVWEICEAKLPQLLLGNAQFYSVLTFETLLLLPIPFVMFYSYFDWEEGNTVEWITWIPCGSFILCNMLQFAGVWDISQSIIISHISMVLSFALLCYMNFRHRRKAGVKWSMNIETIGFCILAVSATVDIVSYNLFYNQGEMSLIYVGLLIYIVSLMMQVTKGIYSEVLKGRKAAMYEDLAYHDKMTGLWNRTAYQEYLNELMDLGVAHTEGYGVFVFDINNLKKLNDHYGHDKGDAYIIANASYLEREMEDIGRVYRTGGDEFICIFDPSMEAKAREWAERIEERIRKGRDTSINFAFGFAVCSQEMDKSFEDTIKRADAAMYANKRKHKIERE